MILTKKNIYIETIKIAYIRSDTSRDHWASNLNEPVSSKQRYSLLLHPLNSCNRLNPEISQILPKKKKTLNHPNQRYTTAVTVSPREKIKRIIAEEAGRRIRRSFEGCESKKTRVGSRKKRRRNEGNRFHSLTARNRRKWRQRRETQSRDFSHHHKRIELGNKKSEMKRRANGGKGRTVNERVLSPHVEDCHVLLQNRILFLHRTRHKCLVLGISVKLCFVRRMNLKKKRIINMSN